MGPRARDEQHRPRRRLPYRSAPHRAAAGGVFRKSGFTERRLEPRTREPRTDADSDQALDSDRELVAAVLAGERDRFEPLLARHGPALAAWIERKLADREEAREVFQETWVRAFEGLAELRETERLRAWLISIAHNVLRQRFRRARLAPAAARDELDVELAEVAGEVASSPGSALERGESLERARHALARLSERQREIFLLRVEQELSHAEIAALLSIREENSRAHFHLAVRALRRELGEDDA